jgi:mono/diheme cytochrome c family protein
MKLPLSAMAACTLFLAWCRVGSLVQQASSRAAALCNPLRNSEEAQRAGAKLYARECAACHGVNREGRGTVPPLNRPEVCQAAPGVLFWILRNGSLHTGMPSFAHLPEPERWQIITFWRQSGGPEWNGNGHSR